MKRNFVLLMLLFFGFGVASGQIFRYRISASSGIFLGEVAPAESEPPGKISHPGYKNFSPVFKPGAEMEVVAPVAPDFELGLQFGYSNFAGQTPSPPLYNFFLSRFNPLPTNQKYPSEALIYDTKILNILGTSRFYILPVNRNMNIFMKLLGGVSFIGTDFTFKDPGYRVEYDVGMLYSRGTKSSDYPKKAAFTGGVGLGTTYRLSDKLDIYFDATASLIHSDIVNGVPNYNYTDYNNGKSSMERTNSPAAVAQASIGFVYSAVPNRRINKSNYTRSSRTTKNIFNGKKRVKPFSKKRR